MPLRLPPFSIFRDKLKTEVEKDRKREKKTKKRKGHIEKKMENSQRQPDL